ncbi:M-phase phosphoprotein 6 [Mugil cephalus]|uniref:M-phase phosphoprotein 6 n=1 Tax=Mugil cephalus TaxID=48193 RepID=UPI001FB79A1C|nr:M-phase phosphoprotein 6 [Mugil cephalus]
MTDSVKLSKNVLRMKFMQRGLDAETRKQLEEDERRIISDEHWFLDLPELTAKENLILEEKSFVPCEDLFYGRMSFRGFNPEVEKLMALMNPKTEEEDRDDDTSRMQTDVTDEEMARRYESLVGSMKKKFAKKRERTTMDEDDVNQNVTETKRSFMKPQD